jgi:hypothetical protein
VERKGFHVPCNTDLDCFSRCGSAPPPNHPEGLCARARLEHRLAI